MSEAANATFGCLVFIMVYWQAARHPRPCMLFVLPLLAVYEYSVVTVGGTHSVGIRNGADAWLRQVLESAGPGFGLLAPVGIGLVLIVQSFLHRYDAPDDSSAIMLGMALESIGFALGLWALSRSFGPFLDSLGVTLAAQPVERPGSPPTPLSQSVTFLGAGIYEEVIFRLGVFGGATALLRMAMMPRFISVIAAALLSAVSFAAVHHLGARGESVDGYVFAFRVIAGLVFAGLYAFRGFGVAVGTHVCYDMLVGIPM